MSRKTGIKPYMIKIKNTYYIKISSTIAKNKLHYCRRTAFYIQRQATRNFQSIPFTRNINKPNQSIHILLYVGCKVHYSMPQEINENFLTSGFVSSFVLYSFLVPLLQAVNDNETLHAQLFWEIQKKKGSPFIQTSRLIIRNSRCFYLFNRLYNETVN